ncbi:MAG: beta-galactosidase [Leptospiraceae bacterium]|nr:beta-galactosidase [Leptospiraceae bacterium]
MSTFRSSDFSLGVSYYPDYVEDFLCAEIPVYSPSHSAPGERGQDSHSPPSLLAPSISEKEVRHRIVQDLDAMCETGLSVLRMGEFSWAHVEPREGQFFPDRFLFALEEAKSRDLKIIFCTPTATPPPWLTRKHPEILPLDRQRRTIGAGSRRHCNLASQAYLDHSRRITEYYASIFGNHEAVCGFQVDNEFGCHGSAFQFNPEISTEFSGWLARRYGSINDLNRLWFGAFWSRVYSNFYEIPLPDHTYADNNPHLELEFRRFSSWLIERFQKMQADIVRAQCGKWNTHNFMSLFSDIDHWSLVRDLDYAGFDHYQMKEFPDFRDSLFQFYLMRSLKPHRPYLLLEQQPLQVNWQTLNRRLPYHYLFLWTFQAFFQGAGAVLYFSWQRFRGGAERMHDGLISHGGLNHENWQRKLLRSMNQCIEDMQHRLQPGSSLEDGEKSDKQNVTKERLFRPDAIVFLDYAAFWAHDICSQSEAFQIFEILNRITALLQSLGWSMAFCRSPDDIPEEHRKARCWIFPGMQFALSPTQRQACDEFRKAGGSVLSFPTTGQMDSLGRMIPSGLTFLHPDAILDDFGALGPEEKESILAANAGFPETDPPNAANQRSSDPGQITESDATGESPARISKDGGSMQEGLTLSASLWAEKIHLPEETLSTKGPRGANSQRWSEGDEPAADFLEDPAIEVLARFQGGLYSGAPAILRSNAIFHDKSEATTGAGPKPGHPWVHVAAFPATDQPEQIGPWANCLAEALGLVGSKTSESGAGYGTDDCIYIPELLCFQGNFAAYIMHGESRTRRRPGQASTDGWSRQSREILEEGLDPHRPALKYCLNKDLSLHIETLQHTGTLKCSLEAGQILILPRKESP